MHIKEIESVLSLSKEELYKTFRLRISDSEQIWVLDDDGILCYGDNDGNKYFPVWPEEEFANLCAIDDWSNAKPFAIELDEFLEEYIPELIASGDLLSIFPRANEEKSIILSPKEFAQSVVSYMEEWYGDEFNLEYLN